MRKFTSEEVVDVFSSAGYKMIGAYTDCKSKVSYVCPAGAYWGHDI